MSDLQAGLERVARSLLSSGLDSVEVYTKTGRSRRAALGAEGRLSSLHHERGWAVRASGPRSSLFCCGSGPLPETRAWPAPDGMPIRLPGPRPAAEWREPASSRIPLCVEHEAKELLEACDRELRSELGEARLLRAVLEDGESDSIVVNTRGVEAGWRQRNATLYLEAALGDEEVVEYLGASSARDFNPRSLARRIADRLLIRRDGSAGASDRRTVLLAPPVAVRLLAALLPILLGGRGGRPLLGGREDWGARGLGIVDDGRLPGGLFAAPVDGEGVPTAPAVLVEDGVLRSTLEENARGGLGAGRSRAGCVRRSSYRDVPRVGPSHLFIVPDRSQAPGALLAELERGHYFLESLDRGRFDLEGDRFEIAVGGFAVRDGRPTSTISGARLSGTMTGLLGGLEAVARDLTFFPLGGLLGSPSLLISGLDVNRPTGS